MRVNMIAIYRRPVRKPSRRAKQAEKVAPIRGGRKTAAPTVDYVHSKEFDRKSAESKILSVIPLASVPIIERIRPNSPADNQPYIAGLYETPLLSPEAERQLFRRFNYLKFKANRLLRTEPKPSAKTRTQVAR